MLQPKRTKFRKVQKGRNTGLAHRGSTVSFGTIALKSIERGQMTARQIEAARRTISRRIKRGGKILYEMDGVSEELAREAFTLAAAKLPFKTTIVTRTVM